MTGKSEVTKFKMGYYGVYHDPRELVHFGIKRRSGRYPYGSGERPYQDQEKSSLSYRVGKKRLEKRRNILSRDVDRYNKKVGLQNNMKSLQVEQFNNLTKDILEEDDRVEGIGRGTILRRTLGWTGGGVAAAGAAFAGAAVFESMAITVGAPLIPLGLAYIYHRKTTY